MVASVFVGLSVGSAKMGPRVERAGRWIGRGIGSGARFISEFGAEFG